KKPTVIDADAIAAVKLNKKILKGKPFVITPHRGEFKELAGKEASKETTLELAKKLGCIILAKGHIDLISDGKKVFQNDTGNPYMAVGGTGDVLAGIVAALLARGIKPIDASVMGAYITGRAGDIAASLVGESMMATDVIDSIVQVVLEVKDE
ncbi:MAG: NAD(P)H-hydrate dehydratase, partial [Candidatus Aenigmarchaeota archaeon]|nr:NAD(P)H-hydrate dehydratase [Candidatus Aenigmarchaeota archaeon]